MPVHAPVLATYFAEEYPPSAGVLASEPKSPPFIVLEFSNRFFPPTSIASISAVLAAVNEPYCILVGVTSK
jgi:hypothetical protein